MREPTEAELRQELLRDPDNRSLTEWSIQCWLSDERYRKQLIESWKALNFPRKTDPEIPYRKRTSESSTSSFEQEQAAIDRSLRRGGYKTWEELKDEYRRTGLTERERDEAEKHKHDHWGVLRSRDDQ